MRKIPNQGKKKDVVPLNLAENRPAPVSHAPPEPVTSPTVVCVDLMMMMMMLLLLLLLLLSKLAQTSSHLQQVAVKQQEEEPYVLYQVGQCIKLENLL